MHWRGWVWKEQLMTHQRQTCPLGHWSRALHEFSQETLTSALFVDAIIILTFHRKPKSLSDLPAHSPSGSNLHCASTAQSLLLLLKQGGRHTELALMSRRPSEGNQNLSLSVSQGYGIETTGPLDTIGQLGFKLQPINNSLSLLPRFIKVSP